MAVRLWRLLTTLSNSLSQSQSKNHRQNRHWILWLSTQYRKKCKTALRQLKTTRSTRLKNRRRVSSYKSLCKSALNQYSSMISRHMNRRLQQVWLKSNKATASLTTYLPQSHLSNSSSLKISRQWSSRWVTLTFVWTRQPIKNQLILDLRRSANSAEEKSQKKNFFTCR